MLHIKVDARRCSYFALQLPVVKAAQKNSRWSGPCLLLEGGLGPNTTSNRRFFRPEANFYHHCTAVKRLKVYCGAAMIEVCLWSKKSASRWVFLPTSSPGTRLFSGCKPLSRLRVDKVRTGLLAVFLCCLYFVLWRKWQESNNDSPKKKWLNRWIHTKKHRNTSKVSLLYLFYRKISKNNDI